MNLDRGTPVVMKEWSEQVHTQGEAVKTRCAFCESMSVMEPVTGKELPSERSSAWTGIYECHHCNFYMVAYGRIDSGQRSMYGYQSSPFDGLELAARVGNFTWYPSNARSPKFDGLPQNIETAAAEAHVCFGNGQIIAAAITARATLESIVKDMGAKGSNLYEKVECLQTRGEITKLIEEQAHSIRNVGNDMAHGDFDTLPDREEVEHVIEFMDALIDTLYVQPAKLRAVQEKRANRKGK